jgi:hypothetical protein
MEPTDKIYFSYRNEAGEIQHASISASQAPDLLGSLMTQLMRYTSWIKRVPGELIDPEVTRLNNPNA